MECGWGEFFVYCAYLFGLFMKSVVSHWWMQRLTAVGLIPLSLWFLFMLVPHVREDYTQACAFLKTWLGIGPALLLTGCLFYHGALGFQVILEDYISCPRKRALSLSVLKGVSWSGGLMGVGALLTIFFQG